MFKLAYVMAAALLLPAPAFSQIVFEESPVPAAAPAESAVPKSDVDKLECRRQETIGSRLQTRKVCLTKEQWFQVEQQYKEKVQQLQIVPMTSH